MDEPELTTRRLADGRIIVHNPATGLESKPLPRGTAMDARTMASFQAGTCPVCGLVILVGDLACSFCSHDFRRPSPEEVWGR